MNTIYNIDTLLAERTMLAERLAKSANIGLELIEEKNALRAELAQAKHAAEVWEGQTADANYHLAIYASQLKQKDAELAQARTVAQAQSDEVQRFWLSPVEAEALRAELAQARKIADDYSAGYQRAKESFDAELAQARQRIAELEGGWVSVKDRLPTKKDDGLLVWGYRQIPEFISVWTANYIHGEWIDDSKDMPLHVTHWRPLPTPPAEEVKDE